MGKKGGQGLRNREGEGLGKRERATVGENGEGQE